MTDPRVEPSGGKRRVKPIERRCYRGTRRSRFQAYSFRSQEQTGIFDEATNSVKGRPTGTTEDEGLVNDAAMQTILRDVLVALIRRCQMETR
jgi:hypothetical protein